MLAAVAFLVGTLDLKGLVISPPQATLSRWGKPSPLGTPESWSLSGSWKATPSFRAIRAFRPRSKPKGWHRTITYRWSDTAALRKDGLRRATLTMTDGTVDQIWVETVSRPGARAEAREELYRSLSLEAPKTDPERPDQSYFYAPYESDLPRVTTSEHDGTTGRAKIAETPPATYLSASVRPPNSKRLPPLSYGESFACQVNFGADGTPREIEYTLPLGSVYSTLALVGLKPKDLLGAKNHGADDVEVEDTLVFERRWRVEWREVNPNPGLANDAIPGYGYTSPDRCSLAFEKRA